MHKKLKCYKWRHKAATFRIFNPIAIHLGLYHIIILDTGMLINKFKSLFVVYFVF